MEGNCLGDLLGWAVLKQLFKYLCAPQDFQRAHLLSHKQPAAWSGSQQYFSSLFAPSSLCKKLQVSNSELITTMQIRKTEAYKTLNSGRARKHQK